MSVPWTQSSAAPAMKRAFSSSSRRRVPTTVTGSSAASAMAWTPMVSTGWALTSIRRKWPWFKASWIASVKRTGWRRPSYQYVASIVVVSSCTPVTVEISGTWDACGATGARTSSSFAFMSSTWMECEA